MYEQYVYAIVLDGKLVCTGTREGPIYRALYALTAAATSGTEVTVYHNGRVQLNTKV
jgi:hypothetical protein